MQSEIKVINGQTIFDLALFCYNDASLVYTLIYENPTITDIGMDLTGLNLVYTPKKVVKYEAKQNIEKSNKVVTILENQSIFDLSLQYNGNVSDVYNLIQNNSFLDSILSNEISGNILTLNSEKNFVNDYYLKNNVKIGTLPKPKSDGWILETGFWDDSKTWKDDKTWID